MVLSTAVTIAALVTSSINLVLQAADLALTAIMGSPSGLADLLSSASSSRA